jgi:hypothetical protein
VANRNLDAQQLQNGVSSYEVARSIGVTQKSAWFMLHRIRTAMDENGESKLGSADQWRLTRRL